MSIFQEQSQEFEQSFLSFLKEKNPALTQLAEAMNYALLGGGKRIRPVFSMEAANLVSLHKTVAMNFAFAIEIAHTFSLVHDDLPTLDNDDLRRGIPTVHKKVSEAQALLTGDALLNFANETLFNCSNEVNSDAYFRSAKLFNHSIGKMILGQSEELIVDVSNLNELLRIQSLKTGKLFQASILCPLLLGGSSNTDSLYLECEQFADAFGFAFQIADDLEDEAQDQNKNSKNILSHLGRASAIELAHSKLNACKISKQFSATKLLLSKLK